MEYSEKVFDHFTNPRNVGEIADANGVGEVGNAKCGDIMKIYLKVSDDGIIEDVKFKTFGCGAAIATSSMATEMVKGSARPSRTTTAVRARTPRPFWAARATAPPATVRSKHNASFISATHTIRADENLPFWRPRKTVSPKKSAARTKESVWKKLH